jgi:hypothetical protein
VAEGGLGHPPKNKKLLGYPWNFYKITTVYIIYIYLVVKTTIIIIGPVDTCCALPPGGSVFDSWQHPILFYKGKSIPQAAYFVL